MGRRESRTPSLAVVLGVGLALGCGGRTGLDRPPPADAPVASTPAEEPLPLDSRAADLSAGLFHTCAVGEPGDTWCWGFNTTGQLGDGSDEIRRAPVRVSALEPAVFVRGGREHTCALTRTGAVRCWGSDLHGQLGPARSDYRSRTPVPVPLPGEVVDLAAGGMHTCAVTAAGALVCWGDDEQGQLGGFLDPTHRSWLASPDLPEVSSVSAGWMHTCAVMRRDGEVRCWGQNHRGQLGRPADDLPLSREPLIVELPGEAVQVSAGDHHSCAVLSSGEVWCWGDNGYGQLGDGSRATPSGPVRVGVADDVVQVGAGHEHTCALRRGGEVACWGRADRGQLGTLTDDATFSTAAMGDGLTDVVQITVGWRHACARREGGETLCWGRNAEGQLGTGSTAMRQTPTPIVPP